jgi:hypothetical protein
VGLLIRKHTRDKPAPCASVHVHVHMWVYGFTQYTVPGVWVWGGFEVRKVQ